jgi:hypothetical protein
MKQNSYSSNKQPLFPASKDTWISVTSNFSNKARIIHSNLIQSIPQTANKFEVISNVNEESESSNASAVEDIISYSRSFRKKHQKKTLTEKSSTKKDTKL